MRTKNAKRLWPVPATVAVVALAAFLAFGLMATNGAQTVAAQQDADCEFTFTTAGLLDPDVHDDPIIQQDTGIPIKCDTKADTATVKVIGPTEVFPNDNEPFVRFYIEDSSGALNAFAPGEDPTWMADNNRYEIDNAAASTKKYRFLKVDIPAVETNPNTGVAARGSHTFTVEKSKGGKIYIYTTGATLNLTAIADIDRTPESNQRRGLVGSEGTATITFLGTPALGTDSDNDRNTVLDDYMQCSAENDANPIVDDNNDGNVEGVMGNCIVANVTNGEPDMDDTRESRSKLVGYTNVGTDVITHVIGGKSGDHLLDANDEITVTVFARIEDADMNPLPGSDVRFVATFQPSASDLKVDFGADRTEDALKVLARGATAETGKSVAHTLAMGFAGIEVGDAVAFRTVTGLPTSQAFKITFDVTVGDLDLGSVVITRADEPSVLKAGVFNGACLSGVPDADENGNIDYGVARVDLTKDDCDDSGMASRFGAGELIVVKAHLEDSLGNVVGSSSDLDSELANEDGDLLGDADLATIINPVSGKMMPRAWVYTVDKDATLGDHMITVSTTARDKDENAINDVTLTVSVAGPPDDYMISGPDNIDLGGRAMFTVTAVDANDGIPHFITMDGDDDKNDTVEIVVPDIAESLVRGSELRNGILTLDSDTAMGTFTIYAPSNAAGGSTARIFVSAGDVEITHTVTFGAATPVEGDMVELMMPTGVRADSFLGLVNVEWTAGQGADGHAVLLFNDADNAFVDGDFLNDPTVTDHTFKGVASGDYYVIVAAYQNKDEGGRDYEYDYLGVNVTVR